MGMEGIISDKTWGLDPISLLPMMNAFCFIPSSSHLISMFFFPKCINDFKFFDVITKIFGLRMNAHLLGANCKVQEH
jgi:hypothetical protein